MKVAEAIVDFVGDFASVDAGLGVIPSKAEPIAKKVGMLFNTNLAMGLMAGGAAITTIGGVLVAASAPIEKAQATLRAAVESTGKAFDDTYQNKVKNAIVTQEKFGHGSADTQEALAKLTVGFKDPAKALDEMTRAEELAAMKHISLADAAGLLVKAHAGSTRMLKDYGINIKDVTGLTTTLTAATKTHDTALSNLSKAQDALSQLEARDAGVKKLSVSQEQQLAAAHQKVDDAQGKVASSAAKLTAAQKASTGAAKDGEEAFNRLIDKYHGAELQSDTFAGKVDMVKAKLGDFAGAVGGTVGPVLAGLGPVMMTVGAVMQTLTMFTGLHNAATAADTVAVEANTSVGLLGRIGMAAGAVVTGVLTAAQWALNVALNANPIGLVIAALALLVGGVILAYTHIGWFKNFVDNAWQSVQVLWGWLSHNLLPVLGTVAGFIGGVLVGQVQAAVAGFQFWAGVIGAVVGAIGGLWNALSGAASTALSLATNIGTSIINGIKNGINSAINGLSGALHALAMLLPGPVKDALGIHSPSSVFADQVGVPIVEGIAAGITKSGAAHRALAGLQLQGPSVGGAGSMPSLASAMSAAAASGAGGAGGQTIINNFNAPIDPAAGRRIGRDLAWEMKA